jgi:hypothetical protein
VFKDGDILPVSKTTATFLNQLLKDDREEIWKQVKSDFSARFRKISHWHVLNGLFLSINDT